MRAGAQAARSASRRLSTSGEVRQAFLTYFERQGHERVASSPLVPAAGDQTLLFTNAGMVQFKQVLLGREQRPYSRATSAQRCLRAGGKHNDLENVGFTPRHHTMFEMLGNFSFGDYFKEDAIAMAWNFVTRELGLPAARLRVTVFRDDDEAEAIWRRVAGPALPIHRLGLEDNFWSMGDGEGVPCGPCSEIFFDTGREDLSDEDRYLEIWNLVFMQSMSDGAGGLRPLPRPSIDTGMGLERVSAVLQGVESNFETDLLGPLVAAVEDILGPQQAAKSLFPQRVIADHARAAAFLVADGVVPSNVGRGYVLRRIIRRALGFGHRAGVREPFFSGLTPVLERTFEHDGASVYPELAERRKVIAAVLGAEEALFSRTLENGMQLLRTHLPPESAAATVPAEAAFQLHDTFGFPLDLTVAMAQDHGLAVDTEGYTRLMDEQRARSGAGEAWAQDEGEDSARSRVLAWQTQGLFPEFTGHQRLSEPRAEVLAVEPAHDGLYWLALSPCPFYGAGGGQEGDHGVLRTADGRELRVLDASKPYEGGLALLVDCGGDAAPEPGRLVEAQVDAARRRACSGHHTATHLLHAALRQVLGDHVLQAGSAVSEDRLRFDFAHAKPLTDDEIAQVEHLVNAACLDDAPVRAETMSLEEAKAADALMLFTDKYGDQVRVLSIDTDELRSVELCGGTHLPRTSLAFPFKILAETSVAAGTRRIEAAAGPAARDVYETAMRCLAQVADAARAPSAQPEAVLRAVERLATTSREKTRQADRLAERLLAAPPVPLATAGRARLYDVPDLSPGEPRKTAKALQTIARRAAEIEPDAVHVVTCGERAVALAAATEASDAGRLLRQLFDAVDAESGVSGRGGGRGDFAQGQFERAVEASTVLACLERLTSTST